MPRKPTIDTGEYTGSSHFDMPTTGDVLHPGSEEIVTGEAVAASGAGDYMAQLAFMEEKMTVMVATTTDKNAEPMPAVYVNGVSQFFPRGIPVTCKRKFVEGLVRAKPIDIQANSELQTLGSEPVQRVYRNTAYKYPFQVVRDPNPRGAAWLEALMSEDQMVR